MLKDNLTSLLMTAMKEKDAVKVACLKAIKASILNYEKAPGAEPLTETAEINIIKKMVKQREDSIKVYLEANRPELAEAEKAEMDCLMEFIPKPATEEEILCEFDTVTSLEIELVKKNMSKIIKAIKTALPNADGKMVAKIVSSHLS